jgi:hypothetical protein
MHPKQLMHPSSLLFNGTRQIAFVMPDNWLQRTALRVAAVIGE